MTLHISLLERIFFNLKTFEILKRSVNNKNINLIKHNKIVILP